MIAAQENSNRRFITTRQHEFLRLLQENLLEAEIVLRDQKTLKFFRTILNTLLDTVNMTDNETSLKIKVKTVKILQQLVKTFGTSKPDLILWLVISRLFELN